MRKLLNLMTKCQRARARERRERERDKHTHTQKKQHCTYQTKKHTKKVVFLWGGQSQVCLDKFCEPTCLDPKAKPEGPWALLE